MNTSAAQHAPAPRPGVDNVFFALIPEGEGVSQAVHVQTAYLPQLGSHPSLVPHHCLHVSLLNIGVRKNLEMRSFDTTIAMAKEAAGTLTLDPFAVVFDQALSFGRNVGVKPFVLQMDEGREQVAELCKKLKLCLVRSGVHSEDEAATPHMTLARSRQSIPATAIAPVRWTATSLVLVFGVVGETRHIHLQRWPLAGS